MSGRSTVSCYIFKTDTLLPHDYSRTILMTNIWDVIFDENATSPYDSRSLQQKLNDIDKEKRRQEFDQALMNLVFGDNDQSGAALLRNLVECPTWFVPLDSDGEFKVRTVEAGIYKPAIGGTNKTGNSKSPKSGKGGRLLMVFSEAPSAQPPDNSTAATTDHLTDNAIDNSLATPIAIQQSPGEPGAGNQPTAADAQSLPVRRMSGSELISAATDMASGIDGLLLHQKDSTLELGCEYFAELKSLVGATELENILSAPAPDQVNSLMQATFLILTRDGKPVVESGCTFNSKLLVAFTYTDKLSFFDSISEATPIKGENLFAMLAETDYYDGLLINPTTKVGAGSQSIHRLILSPGFAHNILRGIDIRPGAAPLPARSFEEIKLWLELAGFPGKNRKLIDAPLPEKTLVRATIPEPDAWTMTETDGSKSTQPGPLWSPVFSMPLDAPPQAEADSFSIYPGENRSEYGPGPTRILCAGMIATRLNPRFNVNPKQHNLGQSFLLGRYMDTYSRRDASRRLALARELWKLLPQGEDKIPRSALLTVEGAAYVREFPIALTRQWIEALIEHSGRCTKTWVWGW